MTRDATARHRRTDARGLGRELRGDLDWIVVKAMEKDRTRRYETVNGLAFDLERYLESKPIVARPPTLGYTTAKFVRRHRLGVSVLATAAVALIVGSPASCGSGTAPSGRPPRRRRSARSWWRCSGPPTRGKAARGGPR